MSKLSWAVVVCALSFLPSCATTNASSEPGGADEDVVEQYDDQLHVTDIKVGDGETATNGSTVTVHYRGTLTDTTVFDSSYTREPLTFKLGARRVIRGWDQGLVGMRVGGKRTLVIPPSLGYGSKAKPNIPPNSHLIFEVELLAVQP
ncbi:MAG: FKBP-type peptidyl-prolyl cis-trans isomerase [Myxococcaceae bacterium]